MLQRPSQLDEDATRLAKVYRVVPAAHAAGAVLEYLAHTEDEQGQDLVLVNGHLALQDIAVPDSLPERWRDTPYRDDVRAFGDEWIRSAQAVQLPSVRYEAAFNLLINPDHPAWADWNWYRCSLHPGPRLVFPR